MGVRHDIFFSYQRDNVSLVTDIRKKLEYRNMKIWQDISGKGSGIPFSTNWEKVIVEAIHASTAAVIFRSETWKKSKACDDELRIISKLHMPCRVFTLDGNDIIDEDYRVFDVEGLVSEIENWYYEEVNNSENIYRTDLMSTAHSFAKNPKLKSVLPKRHELKNLLDVAKRNDYFRKPAALYKNVSNASREFHYSEEQLKIESNELSESIQTLINTTRKKHKWSRIRRITAAISLFVLIVTTLILYSAIRSQVDFSERTIAQSRELFAIGRVAEASLSEALWPFISDVFVEDIFTGHDMLDVRGHQLLRLLDETLPIVTFAANEIDARESVDNAIITESPYFEVGYSEYSGNITITDINNGSTARITVESVPSSVAWNMDGDMLAISAGNNVYIYYAAGRGTVTKLMGNAEQIASVAWRDNLVMARTEQDNKIIWINPILSMTHSHMIQGGIIASINDTAIPVYVVDPYIIIQKDGEETYISMEMDVSGGVFMDFSPINNYVALSNGSTVMIVDILRAEIVYTKEFDTSIMGVAFSHDGSLLGVVSFSFDGMFTINIETGEIMHSGPFDFQLFALSPYHDGWIASIAGWGAIQIFDRNLQPSGTLFHLSSNQFAHRIVISEEHDFLFSTSNGGNHQFNSTRLHIGTEEIYRIHLASNTRTLSNSAVALTQDENFVAFGSPDGQITIWDTVAMYMVWTSSAINEAVIDISFSYNNERLYALGRSGTVYTLDTSGLHTMRTSSARTAYMNRLIASAMAILQHQYDLGLSFRDTGLHQMALNLE